jgi:formate hydrogenlyase subunit 6/NADH:ubiquinone oxidoreductase subunit I
LNRITQYIQWCWFGVRSILRACFTTLPYLFRIGLLRNEVTESYPDPIASRNADDLPPRSRGLLFNDIDRCTGCGSCVAICPSQCIRLETEARKKNTDIIWVAVFDIDFAKCISCGLCVNACIPGSLIHTKQFEGAAYQPCDLIASFGREVQDDF